MSDWLLVLVPLGLGLVGAFFLTWGIRRYHRSRAWPLTTGTVTGAELRNPGPLDGTATLAPKVRYLASDGRHYEVTSAASDNLTRYTAGRQVPVRYDPQAPERMVVDRAAQNGVAHATVGGCLLTMAVAFGVMVVLAYVVLR